LAAKLELTYEELGNLLEGDLSIDLDLAEKLEDVFNIEKDFWVNLQTIYDKALYDWYL
jgi:plasmid maintenance system antidote protein VapI